MMMDFIKDLLFLTFLSNKIQSGHLYMTYLVNQERNVLSFVAKITVDSRLNFILNNIILDATAITYYSISFNIASYLFIASNLISRV